MLRKAEVVVASDVFHQLYYHFVWTTRLRQPMLANAEARTWLISMVAAEADKRKGLVLACNALPDHVHLLVSLPPCDVSVFVGQVKGATSYAFNREFSPKFQLKWQDGYGVVSLRRNDSDAVVAYIANQEQIHANRRVWPALETVEKDAGSEANEGGAPSDLPSG